MWSYHLSLHDFTESFCMVIKCKVVDDKIRVKLDGSRGRTFYCLQCSSAKDYWQNLFSAKWQLITSECEQFTTLERGSFGCYFNVMTSQL